MICARCASACAVIGRDASILSSDRSASVSTISFSRRPAMFASRNMVETVASRTKSYKMQMANP
jgi:hypothetical protein